MTRPFAFVLPLAASTLLVASCGGASDSTPAGTTPQAAEAPAPDASVTPAFDCAAASGDVETLICGDARLATLDRQMADVYEKALANWPENIATQQRTMQRGWIGGRNECWKETDVRACVEFSYQSRIVELTIQSGQVEAPTPVGYVCNGDASQPVTAAFYSHIDPRAAVLTVGSDQVIAIAAEAASGARYTAPNVEFWEHQGEATLDWFGTSMTCTPR